jgi:hypothetical protein
MKIFDLTGNVILSKDNPDKIVLLDSISKGIYIVALIDETNKKYSQRFINF